MTATPKPPETASSSSSVSSTSSSVDSRSTVPSIRAGFAGLVSCGLAGRSDVAWPGAVLPAGDAPMSGHHCQAASANRADVRAS
jgi:hypothetical protein